MSDFVVHFTKPVPLTSISEPVAITTGSGLTRAELLEQIQYINDLDRTGRQPWLEILSSGLLRPGKKPVGAARDLATIAQSQRTVCFSEIPLDMLHRLIRTRSSYGLGFHKETLIAKGGAPLWYLDAVGEQTIHIKEQIARRISTRIDPNDPFWRLTPFIDHPSDDGPYEWEREWRVIGEMRFDPRDVAFLLLPEEDHLRAQQFFLHIATENRGPAYQCPCVDPLTWDIEQISDVLADISPHTARPNTP